MNVLPFERRELAGAESGEKADGSGMPAADGIPHPPRTPRGASAPGALLRVETASSALAGLVDVFGGVAVPPRRVWLVHRKKARRWRIVALRLAGFLVFGEMLADLLLGDLVDIDPRRQSFRQ